MSVRLIFEDGTVFCGSLFAGKGDCIAEVVFNTAMTGYQEMLTDPSYKGQMVVMTYPMIGSYGINAEDVESRRIFVEALLVREYVDFFNERLKRRSLRDYLNEHNIMGAEGFDTRAITRYVRRFGSRKALLTSSDLPVEVLLEKLQSENLKDNAVQAVGLTKAQRQSLKDLGNGKPFQHRVAVIDTGVKYNILRRLRQSGCDYQIFPFDFNADEILKGNFAGVLLTNGPGDPRILNVLVKNVGRLLEELPIFGICLGHQVLALAAGARIIKLDFGHHGINHPIKNLRTGKVEICSHNHNYTIDPNSLKQAHLEISHLNLLDNTIAGIRHRVFPAFSVQYHPEASPGPLDAAYLFDEFVKMMEETAALSKSGGGDD